MKKPSLALAVLAALSIGGSARAQTSVQVYGLIDAGVEYVNHADAAGDGVVRVISGGKNTSRWGLKGSEDLGGGLKAIFGLEGGVLMDTGAADGALFKRQAYVGLDGRFGRLVAGRSFTTVYEFVIKFDPMAFAPNYSWATTGAATGPSKYGMTTAFDNLVKYSGKSGDFSYGASVGLGEQAANSADARKYALAAAWNQAGLGLMVAFEQVNGSTVAATGRRDETRVVHVGADYKAGDWRYTGGLRGYEQEPGRADAADVRADTYWAGVSRTLGKVTLTGAAYHINVRNVAANTDADPTMLVARGLYALSKRTDLYLAVAHVKGRHGQLVGLSRDDLGFGTSQSGVTAGIQHRF